MPSYGPEVLGPPPRDPAQKYWDPEVQTMDPEKLRALQEQRLRDLMRKVFDIPVPLFKDKLVAAGIAAPEDVKTVDDLRHIPLTVKQDLRDSESRGPALRASTASPTPGPRCGWAPRPGPRASPPSRCGPGATSGSSTSPRPASGGATATGPG